MTGEDVDRAKPLPPLLPALRLDQVLGREVCFTARPPDGASRFLRGRETPLSRDLGTGAYLCIAGETPVICARHAASTEALGLLRAAGMQVDGSRMVYEDAQGYRDLLRDLAQAGRKVCVGHFHPPEELPAEATWVPPALLSMLNDKANLSSLVPDGCFPAREVVPGTDLIRLLGRRALPLVVKVSTPLSTAAGMAVRTVRDADDAATAARDLGAMPSVIVEQYHDFSQTICLNFAADGEGIRYLGAAEQILEGVAYTGSWIEPKDPAPLEAVDIGRTIMETARSHGYRGFAGFDVGLRPEGPPLFFDLNFRQCGSTIPLLLRDAVFRTYPEVRCISTGRFADLERADLVAVLREVMAGGVALPYGCYLPPPDGDPPASSAHVLLLGRSRAEVAEVREVLHARGLR